MCLKRVCLKLGYSELCGKTMVKSDGFIFVRCRLKWRILHENSKKVGKIMNIHLYSNKINIFLYFFICSFIRNSENVFKNTRSSRKFSGYFEIKIKILSPKLLLPIVRIKFTTRCILFDSIKCFWISWIGDIWRYGRYLVTHYATISSTGTELFST